jgi:hypothetical protein
MQGQGEAPAASSNHPPPADPPHTDKADSTIFPCISEATVHSLLPLCSAACYTYGKAPYKVAGVCALWLLRCRDKEKHQQPAVIILLDLLVINYIQTRQTPPSCPASQKAQCTASLYFAVLFVIPMGTCLQTGRCVCIVIGGMQGQGEAPAASTTNHHPPPADPLEDTNKADSIFPCISNSTAHSILPLCSATCYTYGKASASSSVCVHFGC